MLRWREQPDEVFAALVRTALEDAIAEVGGGTYTGLAPLVSYLGARTLLAELEKLLDAHLARRVFMPTDYHFFILYRVLEERVLWWNEHLAERGCWRFGGVKVKKINFDWMAAIFFWDQHFLVSPERYESRKYEEGYSKAIFSIANRNAPFARPHPDELRLSEWDRELPRGDVSHYEDGQDYPYYAEDLGPR